MIYQEYPSKQIELINAIQAQSLVYNPEEITIGCLYNDELSAYRARKVWITALEKNFLLDKSKDFKIKIQPKDDTLFEISCHFITACGRYAFWRLINNQSPEVQFILETAHLTGIEAISDEDLPSESYYNSPEDSFIIREISKPNKFAFWVKRFFSLIFKNS